MQGGIRVVADGASVSLAYDNSGNLTSDTDRAGQTYKYTYNARGQTLRQSIWWRCRLYLYPETWWAAS